MSDASAAVSSSVEWKIVEPRVPAWMLPVVLVATLAAMWPSLRGELVYDDLVIVARNPLITSVRELPKLF